MAVPKRKTSRSKRNMRRSKRALRPVNYVTNSTTGELTLPHRVSLDGYYNNRQIIDMTKKSKAVVDDDE